MNSALDQEFKRIVRNREIEPALAEPGVDTTCCSVVTLERDGCAFEPLVLQHRAVR